MREDLLHYIWKFRKTGNSILETTQKEQLLIEEVGRHNLNSGPDFFNSKIRIGDQLWAGNVEIHVKSSDWYVHGHEKDPAYDSVILHVVYDHDVDIYRSDNSKILTLELKNYIPNALLSQYNQLFSKDEKWIYCEDQLARVDDFIMRSWLERLYIERLEGKLKHIETMLEQSKNDWEAVLFRMLATYFGLKVNGDAFLSMSSSFDYRIVRKTRTSVHALESLFMGQQGLLNTEHPNTYFQSLSKEYLFLKQKFHLNNSNVIPVKFFRLRPSNFPTIRLSQLANLYNKKQELFADVMAFNSIDAFYTYFDISVSEFWKTHYSFQADSRFSEKKLTRSFVDLLLINAIIPLKFAYARYLGRSVESELLSLMAELSPESNTVVKGFNSLRPAATSALQTQAYLQLKTEYCNKRRCLQCAIGSNLMST